MKRKGIFGIPLVYFGLIMVTIIGVILLTAFVTGFLNNAVDWVMGAITSLINAIAGIFGFGGGI